MRGGYAGIAEPGVGVQDVFENLTILSGDDSADDFNSETENEENSYQVVTGTGTNARICSDPALWATA